MSKLNAGAALLLAIGMTVTTSAMPPGKPDATPPYTGSREFDNSTYINANQILMFVTNHGNFGRDYTNLFDQYAGTFYPFTSVDDLLSGINNHTVQWSAGLWLGGQVNGQTRVAIAEYSDEYVPGPMAGGWYQSDRPSFRVYKLYRDSLAGNSNVDYQEWPIWQGAPVDAAGNPVMRGEQMLWTVFNDADPDHHTNDAGRTLPLGIEVQQTVWADTLSDPTDTAVVSDAFQADHSAGTGSAVITAMVVGAAAETGHTYRVVFEGTEPPDLEWVVQDTATDQELARNPVSVTSVIVNGVLLTLSIEPIEGVANIQEMSNGDGPLDPPDSVMGSPNSTGDWYVDADVPGDFSRMNWRGQIGQYSWELRFTENGSQYYDWNTDQLMPDRIPFEAWNIGINTPDDPSDDQRINIAFLDGDASDDWSYGDRVYLAETPYVEPAPNPMQYTWPDDFRIGRIVFRDTSLQTTAPAVGTVVRFTTFQVTPASPADTFTYTVPSYTVVLTGAAGTLINMEYKLYNRGGNTINNCYVALWSDPDLGGPSDDLVGCDTLNDLFFCYNGSPVDAQYGTTPPAMGFKLVKGPVVPSAADTAYFDGQAMPGYRNLGMSAFSRYLNGTDPYNAIQTYNYMQGLQRDGTPYPNGTHYAVPGDPVAGTGELDVNPADRRMMGSFGPFDFNPGDSQYVLVRMAVGQGDNRLESITKLEAILNAPPPQPQQSFFLLQADPEPFRIFWLQAVDTMSVSVLFGYSDEGEAGSAIGWSSVSFGGLPPADSTVVLSSHPSFTGQVLQYYFDPHDLLAPLGPIWDTISYPVTVSGNYVAGGSFNTVSTIPIAGLHSGDVTLDGHIDVADVTALVGFLFRGGSLPDPPEVADVDGSCQFNIADLTYLIANVFRGGPSPVRCNE